MILPSPPPSCVESRSRIDIALVALIRVLFGLGVLCALEPTLPWIADAVEYCTGADYRTIRLSEPAYPCVRSADGICRFDIRTLSLRPLADDTNERRRSRVRLWENGTALQPHASDERLLTTPGAFRHWKNQLEVHPLSWPDCSEPIEYKLEIPQTNWLSWHLRHSYTQLILQSAFGPTIVFGACVALGLFFTRSPYLNAIVQDRRLAVRILLTAATLVRLAIALEPQWNCVATSPDTITYIEGRPTRAPLYPLFLDIWEPLDLPSESNACYDNPMHQLVPAVRTMKALWLASIGFFVWQLSRLVSPWLLAPVVGWTIYCEALHRETSQYTLLDFALSEPLSYALTFLYLGFACAYFSRPGWRTGLTAIVAAMLTILCRPTSLPLYWIFPFMGWREWRGSSWRTALARLAGVAMFASLLLPIQRITNYLYHGRSESPPFSGQAMASIAIQFATPADLEKISDPDARAVFAQCLQQCESQRTKEFSTDGRSTDSNLYGICFAAVHAVHGDSIDDFALSRVLGVIGTTLIRHHPAEYLRLVGINIRAYWRWRVHVPLIFAMIVAAVWFQRTNDGAFLFLAFLGSMPFVMIAIPCLMAVPLGRYQSQFAFAEYGVPPFVGAAIFAWEVKTRLRCR